MAEAVRLIIACIITPMIGKSIWEIPKLGFGFKAILEFYH